MPLTDAELAKEVEKMMTPELQRLARNIQAELPQGWGFGLMVFPMKQPGPLLWVSNAEREDMAKTMQAFIGKWS